MVLGKIKTGQYYSTITASWLEAMPILMRMHVLKELDRLPSRLNDVIMTVVNVRECGS